MKTHPNHNLTEQWDIIYKEEVVASFKTKGAAATFIQQNNKDYFYMLKIVDKEKLE